LVAENGQSRIPAAAQETLADPVDEAWRLHARGKATTIPIRFMGGVAIAMRIQSFERECHDLDLATLRRYSSPLQALLQAEGYVPNKRFNSFSGGERLLFNDRSSGRRLDVFLDRVEMCHTLDFRTRLELDEGTLTPADLLLSKLQIVKMTPKDFADIALLLSQFELRGSQPGANDAIEIGRVIKVCVDDWGWWRTVTRNLETLRATTSIAAVLAVDVELVRARARDLLDALEAAPKSRWWKARALIGERKAWYRDPEEIR
jgi:hypothetical protein